MRRNLRLSWPVDQFEVATARWLAHISTHPCSFYLPLYPAIPWPQWKRLFENYLLASDTAGESADRNKAILLHSLGPEGQRIFYTLPELGEENADNYVKTMTTLQERFVPTVNVVAQRYLSFPPMGTTSI